MPLRHQLFNREKSSTMTRTGLLLCLLFISAALQLISSFTDPNDAAILESLRDQWKNTPPSWATSNDPCGTTPWEGVTCNTSSHRVNLLRLSAMGLKGQLGSDIGGLSELISLDLSYNKGLNGPLSPRLGELRKLNTLVLAGCGFSGNIPDELGNLAELSFLALNSNDFTGSIPSSLGKLSKLYWLDLGENHLTGSLPTSTPTASGLDLLKNAKHFHLNNNQITGLIPGQLFGSDMSLIHVLFDGNKLTGPIPYTIGLVQSLEVLRLDRNALTGQVPRNLNNLTNIIELNLANNDFSGALPDLTGMNSLTYVDLSNNSFTESEPPTWFSRLHSLTTLVMEYGSLTGTLPQSLFSFPHLQQVKLRNNALNNTLNMGSNISQELQLVDLRSNKITAIILPSGYNNTLMLYGNPVCRALPGTKYCLQQP